MKRTPLSLGRVAGTALLWVTCALAAQAATARDARSATWTTTVTFVVDGDTLRVRPPGGGKPVSLRIEGIDAPEICQAGGAASREALVRLVNGRQLVVQGQRIDNYGRLLTTMEVDGVDVGRSMVRSGWAWSYRFRRDTGPYLRQEHQARAAGLGIFAAGRDVALIEPRQFRKEHGSCYPSHRPTVRP